MLISFHAPAIDKILPRDSINPNARRTDIQAQNLNTSCHEQDVKTKHPPLIPDACSPLHTEHGIYPNSFSGMPH